MNRWDYGGYNHKFPYNFKNGSILDICDWTKEKLPDFIKNSDVLFVDPPWNLSNVNSFYTKANMDKQHFDFEKFYKKLFSLIQEIKPRILFIEVGKEYLGEFIQESKKIYKYVTFYNSTYYNKKQNKCYVIHATNNFKMSKFKELEDLDEEKIIAWICENVDYLSIGDLCMGKGLVAYYSHINNKKFYGVELNKKRLSVAVERVLQKDRKIGGK